MAVLHDSRAATMAPAALARDTAWWGGQARQQRRAERRGEGVACAQPVHHGDRKPGHVHASGAFDDGRPLRAALEDDQAWPQRQRLLGVQPRRGELAGAAEDDRGPTGRLPDLRGVVARVVPQLVAPVEVQNRRRQESRTGGGPRCQRRKGRAPAGLPGEARPAHIEHRRDGQCVQRQVLGPQLPVGAGRRAVEGDGEPVGGPGLAERQGRAQRGMHPEPADVDAFGGQEGADEPAVTVVAHGRENRHPDAQPGQAGGDVAGEPADEPFEGADRFQRGVELQRVQVGADAAEHEGLGGRGRHAPAWRASPCRRRRSASPRPPTARGGSGPSGSRGAGCACDTRDSTCAAPAGRGRCACS